MLKDKALENLAAGELLLERGFPNAAASRLYYAMYQAAVHQFDAMRLEPGKFRSGAVEWDHSMVFNNLRRIGALPADKGLYAVMLRLRAKADYGEEPVLGSDLELRKEWIDDFVRRIAR